MYEYITIIHVSMETEICAVGFCYQLVRFLRCLTYMVAIFNLFLWIKISQVFLSVKLHGKLKKSVQSRPKFTAGESIYRVFHKMLYQAPSPQRKKEAPPKENKLRQFLKRSSEPLLNLQNAAGQVYSNNKLLHLPIRVLFINRSSCSN